MPAPGSGPEKGDIMYNQGLVIKIHPVLSYDLSMIERQRRMEYAKSMDDMFGEMYFAFFYRRIDSIVYDNPVRSQLQNLLSHAFSYATQYTYSYLYICADGTENGIILPDGNGGEDVLTYEELRSMMDEIPGSKIVMIEAPYSGSAINPSKGGAFCRSSYHVIVSDVNNTGVRSSVMTTGWVESLHVNLENLSDMDKYTLEPTEDWNISLAEMCMSSEDSGGYCDGCYPAYDFTPVFSHRALYTRSPGQPQPLVNNSALLITATDDPRAYDKKNYMRDISRWTLACRDTSCKRMKNVLQTYCIASEIVGNIKFGLLEKKILHYFSNATPDSFSYIYFSCDGTKEGLNLDRGIHEKARLIPYERLRQILDRIPGTKILILDSNYSGAAIGNGDGPLCGPDYHVITSCRPDQYGFDFRKRDSYSIPSEKWNQALNHIKRPSGYCAAADTDCDGRISLGDIVKYTPDFTWEYPMLDVYDMCYPPEDDLVVFAQYPLKKGSDTSPGEKIRRYYEANKNLFGESTGPIRERPECTYQNYERGVIVVDRDGRANGYYEMHYLLEKLTQLDRIKDGTIDDDLELFIRVTVHRDDEELEYQKQYPDPKKYPRGSSSFRIENETDPRKVEYYSGRLTGETRMRLQIEVWDYDSHDGGDLLQRYDYNFGVENGWGFDRQVGNCEQFIKEPYITYYKNAWTRTNKIGLNFVVYHTMYTM